MALRGCVLHLSDISNPTKPSSLAYQWSMAILSEFFVQGDCEKLIGIPVSPLCDRSTIVVPTSQVGFLDVIVRPSYEVLQSWIPATKVCVENCVRNHSFWTSQVGTTI